MQQNPAMHGLHLTADLYECRCSDDWLLSAGLIVPACIAAVKDCGLRPVGQVSHTFEPSATGPGGVTATVLLAESHLCVHTWPEHRGVTLDVYVCNFSADHSARAHALMEALVAHFAPTWTERRSLERGQTP